MSWGELSTVEVLVGLFLVHAAIKVCASAFVASKIASETRAVADLRHQTALNQAERSRDRRAAKEEQEQQKACCECATCRRTQPSAAVEGGHASSAGSADTGVEGDLPGGVDGGAAGDAGPGVADDDTGPGHPYNLRSQAYNNKEDHERSCFASGVYRHAPGAWCGVCDVQRHTITVVEADPDTGDEVAEGAKHERSFVLDDAVEQRE